MQSTQKRNKLAILFLCLGVLVYSLQDAIIKKVSGDYAVTQALFIRSLVAVPLLICFVQLEAGIRAIGSPQMGWLILRSLGLFLSYTAYYIAFPALPLAEAVALYFTVPLFIIVLAGPLLKESVPWTSWMAVAVGFAGVLIILQPGSAVFEPAALFSLLSALLYGLCALLARRLGATEPASVMTFYQNLVFMAAAVLLALVLHAAEIRQAVHPSLDFLVRPWRRPSVVDFLLMASCGAIAAVGATMLTHAYRIGEANRVGSFEFTGILWLPLWGFLFFDELPRWTTALGAVLIVMSGMIALRGPRSPKNS
jgi:drug/metabolite transporter (DMT)-like permease